MDTLIEKIRKLMERTTANGATEAEAESAAKIASKLMEQYRIQEAEVFGIKEEDIEVRLIMSKSSSQNKSVWRGTLLTVICQVNSCRSMWIGSSLYAVGHGSNVDNVEYLYNHLEKQIDILAKISSVGKGKSYSNSYRISMISRIRQRLVEGWKEARSDANCRAILLLDKKKMEVDEFISNTTSGTYKSHVKINNNGYYKGYTDGGNVSLNKSLGTVKYLPGK